MADDGAQALLARNMLLSAELVALPLAALCEFVWVLARGYKIPKPDIAEALKLLMNAENTVVDRPAAEAGVMALLAGGDFADGVIAHEGKRLGGTIFVSFDQRAVDLLGGMVPA